MTLNRNNQGTVVCIYVVLASTKTGQREKKGGMWVEGQTLI